MFSKFSIKSKLLSVNIGITAVVLASAFLIIMSVNMKTLKSNIISSLNIAGGIVAERCSAALAFSDVESANGNLMSLSSHSSIVYACIRTVDNLEFSEYSIDVEKVYRCQDYSKEERVSIAENYIDIFKPIMLEGDAIGVLQIKATDEELIGALVKSAQISGVVFIGLMILSVFVSKNIMNTIVEPITHLKDLAQNVTDNKDYSLRMRTDSTDEVGVLVGSFNNMLDQIQARDGALLEEKEKAEVAATSAKKYAKETESINFDLENEIRERARIEEELQDLNETLEDKVKERTSELKELNEKIGDIARSAGMAEVASGVLHNVGNVLNSVNVSASVIREQVRKSKSENLTRVVGMLEENKGDLANYISEDDKGKQIPRFLLLLSEQLEDEKKTMYEELDELANSIDHIKNVIAMQQSYAGSYGVREQVSLSDLIEDALKINLQGMERHGIKVEKSYGQVPLIYMDKHKTLQIIINLISNAKHALVDSTNKEKVLTIKLVKEGELASVEVKDTGIGISEEDISHLFEYGFKKRKEGHGYGLHHSALVANELGGKISVHSDGLGKGASFKLVVPVDRQIEV